VDKEGKPRPQYGNLIQTLGQLGGPELKRRADTSRRLIHEQGIVYNVYGDPRGKERLWELDPVPFVIAPDEWRELETGLIQRATLLNRIAADCYSAQELIRSGWLAPALVMGNTVVIKPASLAPLSAFRLIEALHEAGIPPGVVNFVTGSGGKVGDPLIRHPAIRGVSFTGSTEVGESLYKTVSERKIRVQLEMGGKNPTIVLADANLDYAADVLVNGAFFSTGQKCTACSRAIIERPVFEALKEKLLQKTKALKVGNGLAEGVQIGPAVDLSQLETDLKYIEIAKAEGAELLCGGNRLTGDNFDRGYFVEPTIFSNVLPEMRIAQEEVFGPVLALMVAEDFNDAMRIANSVRFGLSASIVTKDLTRVHQFINGIEAGLITVNLPTAGVEYQLPFGGTKESSFGMREQGPQALDFYSETRTVYLKYTQS